MTPEPIKTVSPDLENPWNPEPHYDTVGRLPLVWHPESRTLYLGGLGWHHADTYDHHGLDYYNDGPFREGFIGGGNSWGNGKLKWHYDGPDPETEKQVHHAITQLHPDVDKPTDPIREEDPEDDSWWDA